MALSHLSLSIVVTTTSAMIALAACSAASTTSATVDDGNTAAPSGSVTPAAPKRPPLVPPAEGLVSATRVELHEDGTETVTTTWHTPDEMARHVALRATLQDAKRSGVIVTDTIKDPVGCAYDDVELWDGFNATGATICFVGAGHAYLGNYLTGDSHWIWSGAVRSYWPAAGDRSQNCDGEDGYLYHVVGPHLDGGGAPCTESFSACARSYVTAGTCGQLADELILTD